MDLKTQTQADNLIQKIRHYLITTMGVTINEASPEEFYRAFALTLREEIMINWTACVHTYREKKARMLFYLCMEYMPGRFCQNNIINIHATDLINYVFKQLNRSYQEELYFEPEPGLGNGGLGRLAACLMDSLATQQIPAIGFGLRYQYGIFDQAVCNGVQVERPEAWLLHENPWEYRRDMHAASVFYAGKAVPSKNKKGVDVSELTDYEEVRALSYDIPIIGYKETPDFTVNTLRLWTTKESPRNFQLQRYNAGMLGAAAENTSLTDVLYPNDNNETGKRIRLKQEFLLVSASLQDIIRRHLFIFSNMNEFADKVRIHINDTHPALTIAELQRLLITEHDFGWEEALDIVKTCCNFTNHTILKESLEEWNQSSLQYLLPRQYAIIERINLEFCNQIRQKYPGDEDRVRSMSIIEGGQVKMANLAIYGSHRVNGVAALHTEILKKEIFKDFYEMYPEKFVNVTNGVTPRRWLLDCNPLLAAFITKRIGKQWITQFQEIRGLAKFANDFDSQKEFLEIKRKNKQTLLGCLQYTNPIRDSTGKPIGHYSFLDESALFDVQIKRIHEYKRQLMNLIHVIMIYHELQENPEARRIKRMVFIAGKAAPGYEVAKQIIRLSYCISRRINQDPKTNQKLKLVFIENYNVSKAETIIPAADLSEQISTAGTEASGTGNMKLAMNGALTIGTEDGANIEMHQQVTDRFWPFHFGKTALENDLIRHTGNYNPWDIYMQNDSIRKALDSLRDQSFTQTEEEHQALSNLYQSLLHNQAGCIPDYYFVLGDLLDYYRTQKAVEDLFLKPQEWAEYALQNIAAMGNFSSDESIKNYAKLVWDIQPCPVDLKELEKIRIEYSEHDKCRIFPSSVNGSVKNPS
ncbi:MAG: glycogen/starch/alpha-glucan family phosphorylase [Candidatus Rhabdochlamydia sp.]